MNSFTILKSAHLFSNRNYSFVNFLKEGRFQIVLFFLMVYCADAVSQSRKPKTYALVVGISKYKDEAISSLNYADKDAQAFVDYCTSLQGLGIAKENTRVLTNEIASYWNIIDGLDWLKSVAKKDDQIFIYFAGHGDMESKELKFGYLLAHDSRPMNYLGRSLSLDLLNKTVHTLSIDKKAKVFLITDACHSGKLAGVDFNGSNLVALDLMRLVSKNEVRITSCSEDELSYEDQVWGNGRGAFSYFLLKGMAGGADGVGGTKDGIINVGEIKTYLGGKVPTEVQNIKQANQNPVIMGSQDIRLNQVKSNTTNENLELFSANDTLITNSSTSNTLGARSVTNSSADLAFSIEIRKTVNEKIADKTIDFISLSKKNISNINKVLLQSLYGKSSYSKSKLSSPNTNLLIAKALYDKVQNIIDLYLSGDEAELERRRYYSQVDKPYDQYPYMLDIAMRMLPKDHSLIPSLQMQKEYLIGLSFRLKIPFTKDYMSMVDTALVYQQKALDLDTNAAYIHNELGILHLYNKNYELAQYHFEKANIISPMWSLPYSNLANLALTNKDDKTAKKYVDVALKKQENLQNPYIIDGSIYMNGDNLLFAEEQFQKAIKINSRHFRSFDKLGDLHLKIQDYQASEIYYHEGALRKIGLINQDEGVMDALSKEPFSPVGYRIDNDDIDSSSIYEKDIISHFAVAKYFFDKREYAIAQRWFERVINMDADNPLAYHYIGQTAYHFNDFAKAELYFKKALDFYLDDEDFNKHVEAMKGLYYSKDDFGPDIYDVSGKLLISMVEHSDSLIQIESWNNFWKMENIYTRSQFDIYDPTFYLARTYENWGYFALASAQYKECLNADPKNKTAYQVLWNMYKNRMELESAEAVMDRFGQIYPNQLNDVLAEYYAWALNIFNEDVQKTEYYAYKYGLLLFEIVKGSPETYFANFERSFPNSDEKDDEIDMIIEPPEPYNYYSLEGFVKTLPIDVSWSEPKSIINPVFTGINMLEKVKSISIDKNVKADVFAKLGDLYLYSKEYEKALENYESSLKIKEDNHYLRSMAAKSADYLYLHKKAFDHLTKLEQSNNLKYEEAIILAKYYMKAGNRDDAVSLYDKISDAHLDLKEKIEKDVIKLYLRFEEYPKVIELIKQHLENDTTDMNLEYMLARAHAGLNNPDEAIKHLQNAEKLGFDLGFVYKNDSIFDGFRTSRKGWADMQEKMDGFITLKMASVKDNAK